MTMPLRVCQYILELYERLLKQGFLSKKKLFPAVFPLVLYNGEENWTAPETLEDMIEPVVDARYLPRFRYFKLAENEVSVENLDAMNNLISVLFQVETLDPDDIGKKAGELVAKLRGENARDVLTFAQWLAHYYGEREHPLKEAMDPLVEVRSMLEAKLKRKEEEWEKKYRLEGRQEGQVQTLHDVARRMKEEGLQVAIIAAVTGLGEDVIQKL